MAYQTLINNKRKRNFSSQSSDNSITQEHKRSEMNVSLSSTANLINESINLAENVEGEQIARVTGQHNYVS